MKKEIHWLVELKGVYWLQAQKDPRDLNPANESRLWFFQWSWMDVRVGL